VSFFDQSSATSFGGPAPAAVDANGVPVPAAAGRLGYDIGSALLAVAPGALAQIAVFDTPRWVTIKNVGIEIVYLSMVTAVEGIPPSYPKINTAQSALTQYNPSVGIPISPNDPPLTLSCVALYAFCRRTSTGSRLAVVIG